MNKAMGSRTAQKQQKVLDAAMALVLRNGVRGTTMEAIAREAGIAKPTLYGYFPDKQAVFDAVLAHFKAQKKLVCEAALAGPGDAVTRVATALAEKHKLIFRLLEGSPHASEIYAESKSGHEDPFERWLLSEMIRVLEDGGIVNPSRGAQLLIACAEGIAHHARQAQEIGPAVRYVAEKLFA